MSTMSQTGMCTWNALRSYLSGGAALPPCATARAALARVTPAYALRLRTDGAASLAPPAATSRRAGS